MLKTLYNEVICELTITNTGPLLIRSGQASPTGPDRTPVTTFRDGQVQVYLPGSSLKGVVRSHLEKVCRSIKLESACNPFIDKDEPGQFCGSKFEDRKKKKEEISSATAYADSCLICRMFGSTSFASRIAFGDAYLLPGQSPRLEQRDGVGIDRFSGGAAHAKLFSMEVVPAGASFKTSIRLRNFEIYQIGLLLLALQDLRDGAIRLGGGRSRGLGEICGQVSAVSIQYIRGKQLPPENEVWGLGQFLSEQERKGYRIPAGDRLTLGNPVGRTTAGLRSVATFDAGSLAELEQQALEALAERIDPGKQR